MEITDPYNHDSEVYRTVPVRVYIVPLVAILLTCPKIVNVRGFPVFTGRESSVKVSPVCTRLTAPPEFVIEIVPVYVTPIGNRVERSRSYAVLVPVLVIVNVYGTVYPLVYPLDTVRVRTGSIIVTGSAVPFFTIAPHS